MVSLKWTLPNDNGSPITGYNIYRGEAAGTETYFDSVQEEDILIYTNTGLVNGRTYYYQVAAVNEAGPGEMSNEVSATPLSVPGVPSAFEGSSGVSSITLTWLAPYDDGGLPVIQYKIYRSATSGTEIFLANTTVTTFTDTGLTIGRVYYYMVSAENAFGEGGCTEEILVTVADVPGPVTGLMAVAGNASVTLNWTAPSHTGGTPITGYLIYRGTESGQETFLWNTATLNFKDTDLINGQTYYYKVRVSNSNGAGQPSGEVSSTPLTTPYAPTDLLATRADQAAILTWLAPTVDGGTSILYYRIYRGTTPGTEIFISNSTITSFMDNGLTNGRTYYYLVSAVTGAGEGTKSYTVSVVPATVPEAPSQVTAAGSAAKVTLSWNMPSSGGSTILRYNVYWSVTPTGATNRIDTLTNATTFVHSELTNGVRYYYTISAVTAIGEGPRSPTVFATPLSVPSAPSELTAVGGAKSITLTWTAPSDGGTAVTGYKIYRGSASGGESLLKLIGPNTTYVDPGLPDNMLYYYKIRAINSQGDGPISSEVSARTIDKPGAPQNVIVSSGDSFATLSWSAPSYSGGSSVIGYNVYRNTSGSWSLVASLVPSPYLDTGLQNGHQYGYIVRAVNGLGEGSSSEEVQVMPARVPDAPALAAIGGLRSVNLTWTAPSFNGGTNITGYAIYRGVASGQEVFFASVGNIFTFLDSGLSDGTAYYYRITALNERGEGSPSLEVSATTLGLPGKPVNLSVQPTGVNMHLSWAPSSTNGGAEITSYRVYRGTSAESMISIAQVTDTEYDDPDPENGVSYIYSVSANNMVGEGQADTASAVMIRAPGEPQSLTITPSSHRITLTWSAPADLGGSYLVGYRIYRALSTGPVETIAAVNGTEYIDNGLENGITHHYWVSAVNSLFEGETNGPLSAVPANVPSKVVSVSIVPGVRQSALSWEAPFNGGSSITSYKIYRSSSESGAYKLVISTAAFMFTDTGLLDSTTYWYRVSAVNPVGEGAMSDAMSSATLTPPSKVTGLIATSGDGQIQLQWDEAESGDGSDITYRVYSSTAPGGETLLTTVSINSYLNIDLVNGRSYYYQVSAVNATGEGMRSDEVSAVPTTVPGSPVNLRANPGDGLIILSWSLPYNNGGATIIGYKLYWSIIPNGSYEMVPVTGSSYVHTGLENGVTYYYKVSAVNQVGEGPMSAAITSEPVAKPLAVVDLLAARSNGNIVLTWTDPNPSSADILGYRIYRGIQSGSETLYDVSSSTTYTDEYAESGVPYYYMVTALNSTSESNPSNEVSVVPGSSSQSLHGEEGIQMTEIVMMAAGVMIAVGTVFILVGKGILSFRRAPNK
jgi:fibronectin type 3 domain-containing protein